MQGIVETGKRKAIIALKACETPNGLYASGGKLGYTSVWARDSMISMSGAASVTDQFRGVFAKSISALHFGINTKKIFQEQ